MATKKKKPSKTYYKKKADRFFSLWIRNRDGICQSTLVDDAGAQGCTRELNLQCAHVHSRDYSATRLDPDNAMALCRGCHMYYTQRPLEWREFVDKLYGKDYFDRLGIRALSGARRNAAVNWEEKSKEWERAWTGGK
jgi:hypothetical protein